MPSTCVSHSIVQEKIKQASQLVAESDFDAWIIFVRETAESSDPVLPLILEGGLTWQSALILARDGRRIAVVGNYDADPLIKSGNWDEVIPYVQSIREPLIQAIESIAPDSASFTLGLNYSTNDDKADGLSHGMFLLLQEYLRDLTVVFVSAEELAVALRGQKTAEEVRRMRAAVLETERLFESVERYVLSADHPVNEMEVYEFVHRLVKDGGFGFSWDPTGDPIVNSGPNSMIGHGIPSSEISLEEGHIFHIDLGITLDGYSSDIQRCWYVGSKVPQDVQRGIGAVNRAITAAAEVLRPGTPGYVVDEAARQSIVANGYEEYMHAVGHQVGRVAHDGGTLLGPRWERYGSAPYQEVKENEVYTLELGVILPGRGYLGLEEMVRVTSNGCEWLTQRQMTMPVLELKTTC